MNIYEKSDSAADNVPSIEVSQAIEQTEAEAEARAVQRWKYRDTQVSAREALVTMKLQKLTEDIMLVVEKTEYEQRLENGSGLRASVVEACRLLVDSQWFQKVILFVIAANSIWLAIDDESLQTTPDPSVQRARSIISNTFSAAYLLEFSLKVIATGFLFNKGSYLRDPWNFIDFAIIIQIVALWVFSKESKLSALRVVRILIPLKSLRRVEGLRVLVVSMIHALPLLRDTFILLIFFLSFFGLIGLTNFQGAFKKRCFDPYTGIPTDQMCASDTDCTPYFVCGRCPVANPRIDQASFDNIAQSIMIVFAVITMDGWSSFMLSTMSTVHPLTCFFFLAAIFFGAFFILNLTLAVINNKFNLAHNQYLEEKRKAEAQLRDQIRGLSFSSLLDQETDGFKGLSIRHFIIGKRAAKQMIKFLRDKQQQKKLIQLANNSRKRRTLGQAISKKASESRSILMTEQVIPLKSHRVPQVIEEEDSQSESFDINASQSQSSSNVSYQSMKHSSQMPLNESLDSSQPPHEVPSLRIQTVQAEEGPPTDDRLRAITGLQSRISKVSQPLVHEKDETHQRKSKIVSFRQIPQELPRIITEDLEMPLNHDVLQRKQSSVVEAARHFAEIRNLQRKGTLVISQPFIQLRKDSRVSITQSVSKLPSVLNMHQQRSKSIFEKRSYMPSQQDPYIKKKTATDSEQVKSRLCQASMATAMRLAQAETPSIAKRMLEKLIDTKRQKIILKSNEEYFSSSHADVFEKRLFKKPTSYREKLQMIDSPPPQRRITYKKGAITLVSMPLNSLFEAYCSKQDVSRIKQFESPSEIFQTSTLSICLASKPRLPKIKPLKKPTQSNTNRKRRENPLFSRTVGFPPKRLTDYSILETSFRKRSEHSFELDYPPELEIPPTARERKVNKKAMTITNQQDRLKDLLATDSSQQQIEQEEIHINLLTAQEKEHCIQEDLLDFLKQKDQLVDDLSLSFLEHLILKKENLPEDSFSESLVPSSLESEYEETNAWIRDQSKDYSQSFSLLQADIKQATFRDQFDLKALRAHDLKKKKAERRWSGGDVIGRPVPQDLQTLRVWPTRCHRWLLFRRFAKTVVQKETFESFMTLCVILNIIVLILDTTTAEWTHINYTFTALFLIEVLLKVIAKGLKKVASDPMNLIDALIVGISSAEIVITYIYSGRQSPSSVSAFRVIRIIRVLRVLRMVRLLRQLQSMQLIVGVVRRSIQSFIYIALLLLIFIFMYSVLGISTFGSFEDLNTRVNSLKQTRIDFRSFNSAFTNLFQVLSGDSWTLIMFETMYLSWQWTGATWMKGLSALYYLSFVLIGDYILMNLFLAILIDGFCSEGLTQPVSVIKADPPQEKKITHLDSNLNEALIPRLLSQEQYGCLETELTAEEIAEIVREFSGKAFIPRDKLLKVYLKQRQQADLFAGVQCYRTFFLLNKQHWLRLTAMIIVRHKAFDWLISAAIVLSCTKLAVETYYQQEPPESNTFQIFLYVDYLFTGIFTLEAVLKIISFGLLLDTGSYLRKPVNLIDMFIVIISIYDNASASHKNPMKVIRLLRTLRPLRIITHSQSTQMLVSTLVKSLSGVFNVFLVLLIVWLTFAILGVSFFKGCFTHTDTRGQEVVDSINFDSVWNGMLALTVVSSLNNWDQLMYKAIDSTGELSGYYFIVFILLATYFFLNFFIGVLFLSFKGVQEKSQNMGIVEGSLSRQEEEVRSCWREIQLTILSTPQPDLLEHFQNGSDATFRRHVGNLLSPGNRGDAFFTAVLVLNAVAMTLSFDGAPKQYKDALDIVNDIFTALYTIEAALKIWAFGKKGWFPIYFNSVWNRFDFVIVVLSLGEVMSSTGEYKTLPQIARLLRMFRIVRILRLVGKYRGLQALIQTVIFSLPSLFIVLLLLLILLFIYSILGVFLFNEIVSGSVIDIGRGGYIGFSNFGVAMLTLFKIATNEDWSDIMIDTQKRENCAHRKDCINSFSYLYFLSFHILCGYLMLNLFVLIALEQFDRFYLPKEDVMARFRQDLDHFVEVWVYTCANGQLDQLPAQRIPLLMRTLRVPLGISSQDNLRDLLKMRIRVDAEGRVSFHEMLFRTMKRLYGSHDLHKAIDMQFFELLTLELLAKQRKLTKINQVDPLQKRFNVANTFLSELTARATLKAWLRHSRENSVPSEIRGDVSYTCFEEYVVPDD